MVTGKKALGVVVIAALAGALYVVARHSSANRLNPSQKPAAPSFTVRDLSGRETSLSSYRGKVVLLNFWATWCEPCRKEIPRFIEFQKQYGSQGLQVLGVSLDDDAKPVREFRDQFNVNYPIAMGDAKLAESYGGVLGLPITFIIDPQGRIAAKHVGAVDLSIVEQEIQRLLSGNKAAS